MVNTADGWMSTASECGSREVEPTFWSYTKYQLSSHHDIYPRGYFIILPSNHIFSGLCSYWQLCIYHITSIWFCFHPYSVIINYFSECICSIIHWFNYTFISIRSYWWSTLVEKYIVNDKKIFIDCNLHILVFDIYAYIYLFTFILVQSSPCCLSSLCFLFFSSILL